MRWIRNWNGEGTRYCRYADDCNIYVGSQAAAERTLASIQDWIEKHLRLKVNAAKSGIGRVWERKFLGFRLNRERRIGVAPESLERFKTKVREMWRSARAGPAINCGTTGSSYVRGWWGYFRLAEEPPTDLPAGGLDPTAHPEMLLVAVARTGRDGSGNCGALGLTGPHAEGGSQQPGSVACGQDRQSAQRRCPTPCCDAIGFLMPSDLAAHKPLSSTAGCGKPHVRWCGRVTGRNPRHST